MVQKKVRKRIYKLNKRTKALASENMDKDLNELFSSFANLAMSINHYKNLGVDCPSTVIDKLTKHTQVLFRIYLAKLALSKRYYFKSGNLGKRREAAIIEMNFDCMQTIRFIKDLKRKF